MMLSAPSAAATLPPLRWLPPLRHLAWPLAMLAAWGALIDLRPALLSTDAGAKSIYRCLQTVLVPQSVSMYTERIIESEDPWVDQARRTEALAMSVHTMGWTIRTALYGVEFARQADVPKQTVAAILRVLALNPFFKEYYEQLSAVLGAHPECERLLPKVVRLRLAYLGGDAHLPRPDLHVDPVRIDEAADLYAAIVWSFANDVHWKELEGSLHALCRRYGDIQGVAQLVVMGRCAEPHQAIPWMDEVSPVLEVGLRAPGAMIAALSVASNAAQAQALLPLIEKLFPEIISDCRSGTMHEVHDPLGIALRNGIVRLWGQARSLPAREAGR
jgi:hypothetical protein